MITSGWDGAAGKGGNWRIKAGSFTVYLLFLRPLNFILTHCPPLIPWFTDCYECAVQYKQYIMDFWTEWAAPRCTYTPPLFSLRLPHWNFSECGPGLWRACNLTTFSPCLTGPVDYPFPSRHEGPGFKSLGGYLCETGIVLLALSCFVGDPDVILITGFVAFQWVLH